MGAFEDYQAKRDELQGHRAACDRCRPATAWPAGCPVGERLYQETRQALRAQALAAEVTVRRKRGGVRRAVSAMKSAEADLAVEVGAGGMSRKRFADIRYYVRALERAAIAVGEERCAARLAVTPTKGPR